MRQQCSARDLRCFRYGRDVQPQLLVWELSIGDEYAVMIGWNGTRGISGFSLGDGQSMDASFAQAAAWVADIVQTELAGYDFVEGPHLVSRSLSENQRV
ncbi:hypothetical protein [Rhodococcus sp. C-2]|uniref:hypothetical protein n=1 Tax=Rhodococcus sp. C-2 TaxID=3018809 RepID=UPI000AD06399|nr:hypothetical protein [Rhodococcus sp. C-2]MDA3635405.1 hypothetical protein [Rhodococcus sp. C-2]